MRRLLTIAALVGLTAMLATAQNISRLGVTLGANYNNLHFKQQGLLRTDKAFGPSLGINGELNIAGIGFALESGLVYSMRNATIRYSEHNVWASQGIGNEKLHLHYLDVPVRLKFKYNRLNGLENTFKPMIFVGPTFSFLVGKNLTDVNTYKTVSVLLHFGLGVELYKRWQIAAGYSFSIGETMRTRLLDENNAKNRTWTLQLNYYFKAD